jgi:preprotein translocase subunit SecG
MRLFVYILMGAILLALVMLVTGPRIKASGTAYRASHRMISDARPSRNVLKHWTARI